MHLLLRMVRDIGKGVSILLQSLYWEITEKAPSWIPGGDNEVVTVVLLYPVIFPAHFLRSELTVMVLRLGVQLGLLYWTSWKGREPFV